MGEPLTGFIWLRFQALETSSRLVMSMTGKTWVSLKA